MSLRFPYTETHSLTTGEAFHMPYVPVRIIAPAGGTLEGPVLLDTGANRTHIPQHIAEQLRVDLAGLRELTIHWGQGRETTVLDAISGFRAIIGEFVVPIRPVIGRGFPATVLGHDFLEHFRVTYDGRARTVDLEPHDNVPELMPDGRQRSIEFPAAG